MNKSILPICIAGAVSMVLASCQSDQNAVSGANVTTSHGRPEARYMALPGQEAVAVSSDTNDAFDRAVAAYNNPGMLPDQSSYPSPAPPPANTVRPNGGSDIIDEALSTTPRPVTPPVIQPDTLTNNAGATPNHITSPTMNRPTVQPSLPSANTGSALPTGPVDYSVQIINTTDGRLFIEANDAAGEVYPCGFMVNGQSYTTNKKQVSPVRWPITVVVRDPDQPGTPEIRRYRIPAPESNYANKTIGISVMKGGIYHASLDGRVYYTSTTEN